MSSSRELIGFCAVLAACVVGFFYESLLGGKILSPADVLFVSASYGGAAGADYEPLNRLLMDPVLQFQPWLEFNRMMIRDGRLPLWNDFAGCGAPHLANGQSAVFDPFHLLAYLGPTPDAYAWIAAARLWVSGLGAFLLARNWRMGFWGRWFAGLVYPFCGFVVLWLLYPVTSVAIWMPWLLLATDRVLENPLPRSVGLLGLIVALTIVGGHIQTSAHTLLAALLYTASWLWRNRSDARRARAAALRWTFGILLGLTVASAQILPLAGYLAKSPVWGDRQRERPPWWTLARPRALDSVCTAVPYAYGSQRRGHPNLARALGVHNLNESAAGYTGLATLIWLAPLAVIASRRSPIVLYLAGLTTFGALAAFRLPPVDNLLRALPVLEVTDNRRMTLWLAFGLTMLGGIGLDHLGETWKFKRFWWISWLAASVVLIIVAVTIKRYEPALRQRALEHYRVAAESEEGDPAVAVRRASRQVTATVKFIPRYYGIVAVELALLAVLARRIGRNRSQPIAPLQATVLGITLVELWLFGFGVNPSISRAFDRFRPPVIAALEAALPAGGRVLGIGAELPPNTLMRNGLADPRNYDSIELSRNLDWFAPIYETAPAEVLSSRSRVTWRSVGRARGLLEESGVAAVVAAHPPTGPRFGRVERLGDVWVLWLDPPPQVDSTAGSRIVVSRQAHGELAMRIDAKSADHIVFRQMYDSGWRAYMDGARVQIQPEKGVFCGIDIPYGIHNVNIKYDPPEVRLGLALSLIGAALMILVLTRNRLF
jgi:hypothetical protein